MLSHILHVAHLGMIAKLSGALDCLHLNKRKTVMGKNFFSNLIQSKSEHSGEAELRTTCKTSEMSKIKNREENI